MNSTKFYLIITEEGLSFTYQTDKKIDPRILQTIEDGSWYMYNITDPEEVKEINEDLKWDLVKPLELEEED